MSVTPVLGTSLPGLTGPIESLLGMGLGRWPGPVASWGMGSKALWDLGSKRRRKPVSAGFELFWETEHRETFDCFLCFSLAFSGVVGMATGVDRPDQEKCGPTVTGARQR